MRVTLTYDLPEEKAELFEALHGFDWKIIVSTLLDELRQRRKYKCENDMSIRELEQFVYAEMEERSLDIWS